MRRIVPLLIAAALSAGCTTVHPAPAAPPSPPTAAGAYGEAGPAGRSPLPPSFAPRQVSTGPDPADPSPAPRPVPRRHRPRLIVRGHGPAVVRGRASGTGGALCRQGVRLRRIPSSWADLCRAAMGG